MKDVIDTRNLQARLDELTDLSDAVVEFKKALATAKESGDADEIATAQSELDNAEIDFGEAEQEELDELTNLAEEVSEWRDGNTLIHESYFVDYCKRLLKDIGDLPKDLPPYIVIDWESTADNLKVDYSEVIYRGETYLVRQY